ncbi:MAG: glycosyl transferase family 51 [Deltaproteobacteria bacterium]|nr:MAG: glycosyl transferase family 51 [Deltaproteobacteria bacterium]
MPKKIILTLFSLILVCCGGAAGFLYYLIVVNPGPEIELANIRRILSKESHVFYEDGKTRLGAFFEENHRQYVKYEQIPQDFINALVAAEDDQFFRHYGFDPVSIIRAAIKNFKAGRVVQGGSTLTQQTAKNLFKRSGRSYQAKLKELLFALKLEYWYTKEQIFEFYANQFYVSGNGHGLGVAARYYFDKKVEDLSLNECIYIAGSVKKPNDYNPFIKKSEKAAKIAVKEGKKRSNYVLDRMYELKMLSPQRYRQELKKQTKFKNGTVGFRHDPVMEMVRQAMAQPEITEALERQGISNVATAGIRIITSIDKDLQDFSLQMLRHELSGIDIRLNGYDRSKVQETLNNLDYKGDDKVLPGAFLFGEVESIKGSIKKPNIVVNLGSKRGKGTIDREGLTRAWFEYAKWSRNKWAKPEKQDLIKLLAQLKPGDKVWVSVASVGDSGVMLTLEKYPAVQGGAIVLHHGSIKAMTGGVENRFFNRAIDAKRTMGSSFKPFLYAAAIQLGWNAADILTNKRNVFVFQNQPYYPRPDHKIKNHRVSMSWAGVHSENVASIWLAYHLCDQLNAKQFREVAAKLGFTPRVIDGRPEPYRTYKIRIRDRYGIQVNDQVLRKAAFKQAVKKLETDFIFEGLDQDYQLLVNMNYGLGFKKFAGYISRELGSKKLTSRQRNELWFRRSLLYGNFLALASRMAELDRFREMVEGNIDDYFLESDDGAGLYYDYYQDRYVFGSAKIGENLQRVYTSGVQERLFALLPSEREDFWKKISLDDMVSAGAVKMVTAQMETEYAQLAGSEPYSFETLAAVDDFRVMVGLNYLVALAREMGVVSEMEPVLSFPLGSNAVSLYETTRIYEGLATGKINFIGKAAEGNSGASLAIIKKIESSDGEVLYSPVINTRRIFSKKTSLQVSHILENIIKFGTGRYADRMTVIHPAEDSSKDFAGMELKMPLLGKTGTANNYTNASFFGFLPGVNAAGDGVNLNNGYVIGVYAGYDKNEAMRKGSNKIAGSSGALPTWTGIVNHLIKKDGYAEKLNPVDLSFNGLTISREGHGQVNLKVDADLGGRIVLPMEEVSETARYSPSIMTFTTEDLGGVMVKERNFEPFWKVGQR